MEDNWHHSANGRATAYQVPVYSTSLTWPYLPLRRPTIAYLPTDTCHIYKGLREALPACQRLYPLAAFHALGTSYAGLLPFHLLLVAHHVQPTVAGPRPHCLRQSQPTALWPMATYQVTSYAHSTVLPAASSYGRPAGLQCSIVSY